MAPEAPPRAGGDGEGALEGYRPAALLKADLLAARSRSGNGLGLGYGLGLRTRRGEASRRMTSVRWWVKSPKTISRQ